jgi:hypothetical protein
VHELVVLRDEDGVAVVGVELPPVGADLAVGGDLLEVAGELVEDLEGVLVLARSHEEGVVVGVRERLAEHPPLEAVPEDDLRGLAALQQVDLPHHALQLQELTHEQQQR